MGFSLSNFGLVSEGMNRSFDQRAAREDAERRRKQQEDDRAYELERRKRTEEDEARTRAYAEELRQTLPKYLSGGEQAKPAQAAVPGEVLDPFAVDGGEVARTAQAAKPSGDNTEGLYEALKGVAAKYGRLDHYEAMKDRIKKAADEGVLDFIKKARTGTTEPELLESFNKSGKVKLKGLRRAGEDEFMAVTEDGQPVRLNLTSMTESLLAPKDLLTHLDKGAERERKAADAERRASYQGQVLDSKRQALEARSGLVAAQEELARARAEAARNPNAKPRGAGNWNSFDSQVKSLAREQLTGIDPETGKKTVDHKNVALLTSMASALARSDPEAYPSPGEAITAAAEKLDEIRAAQDGAQSQAEDESSGLKFNDEKKRQAWIKSRAERLAKMRLPGKAAKSAPAKPAAPAPTKAASVPQVKTDADYNALPSGAIFIDPDGNRRQKP